MIELHYRRFRSNKLCKTNLIQLWAQNSSLVRFFFQIDNFLRLSTIAISFNASILTATLTNTKLINVQAHQKKNKLKLRISPRSTTTKIQHLRWNVSECAAKVAKRAQREIPSCSPKSLLCLAFSFLSALCCIWNPTISEKRQKSTHLGEKSPKIYGVSSIQLLILECFKIVHKAVKWIIFLEFNFFFGVEKECRDYTASWNWNFPVQIWWLKQRLVIH